MKTIVIFMNEDQDANGREGTEVPLIAHVHSKELLPFCSPLNPT